MPLVKREMGIQTSNKDVTKKPFGRFMYAMRIHGRHLVDNSSTCVIIGLIVVLLKWLMKFLGV